MYLYLNDTDVWGLYVVHIFHSHTSIHIDNTRTLSENITFMCTSFRNRKTSQCLASFVIVSRRVLMYFIFADNVRILCLYCNVAPAYSQIFFNFHKNRQNHSSFCLTFPLWVYVRSLSDQYLLRLALHSTRKQNKGLFIVCTYTFI